MRWKSRDTLICFRQLCTKIPTNYCVYTDVFPKLSSHNAVYMNLLLCIISGAKCECSLAIVSLLIDDSGVLASELKPR